MTFKGFDEWIEIFRGGKQVDSNGKEHDGDAVIDKAVAAFDAAEHEPPLVVGHPKENAPAFGWVEDVKTGLKDGIKVLYARFKQVVPEFEEAVKKGLYKKRSASFYADGRLRHVGFLGAAPPAVKALADLKFKDSGDAVTFDFYDPGMGAVARILRNLRDWLIEKEGKDQADAIIPDWDVENIREEANREQTTTGAVEAFSQPATTPSDAKAVEGRKEDNMAAFKEKVKNMLSLIGVDMSKVPDEALPDVLPEGAAGSFSEADIEEAKKQAAEDARADERQKAETEFAEKGRKKRREAREGEISDWYDQSLKGGKVLPAWAKMGLKEFMLKLDAEDVIEFSEESKITSLDWFKCFMEELPKLVEFKEVATRGEDVQTGNAAEKLESLTKKKMAGDKDLDYRAAFSEVQTEHPDLAAEYKQEMRG